MIGETSANIMNSTVTIDEFHIKVIDYDGTIIDEKYMHNREIYTLPQAPSHTGLVFQCWTSTENIIDGQIIINDNNVIIGAVYTTTSGNSEFGIELTRNTGLTVRLNMDGTKDWGDGNTDSSITHTYSDYGTYVIECNGTSCSGRFFDNNNDYLKSVKLTNITSLGNDAFSNCHSLNEVILSNNITNLGDNIFSSCYNLDTIILPSSITNIGGSIFYYCYSLINIVLPNNITSIGGSAFYYCMSLKNVVIPNSVTSIGGSSFYYCYSMTDILLPDNITTIQDRTFYNCKALKNIKLPNNITSFKSESFYYCVSLYNIIVKNNIIEIINAFKSCCTIIEYDFKQCTSVPTLNSTNAFSEINRTCKIRVRWDLYQDWIMANNWTAYASYIDGGVPANINFTGDNTGNIYVNNKLITGTSTSWVGSNMPYCVYDSANNVLLPTRIATGITEASIQNINIDLSNSSTITLSIGVTGLDVKFYMDGIAFTTTENNGNYSMNIIGDSTTIDYYIDGGDNYFDENGTIALTGSNITKTITMIPATQQTWNRPNLTENGTLGGNDFAVSAEAYSTSTSYQAWRAVDSSTSTSYYWYSKGSGNKEYIFYNPDPIKVTELTYKYTSTSYRATNVVIQGSNDNTNWNNIESTYSGSSTTYTSVITNPKYYKYYKLAFTAYSSYVRIYDMLITATIKMQV